MDIELKEIKYQKFDSISEAGNVKDCPICHVNYNPQQNKQVLISSQLSICNVCFSNQFMEANNHDGCLLRNNSTINFNNLYYKGYITSKRIKQAQPQILSNKLIQDIKKYKLIFLINLLIFLILLLIMYAIMKQKYNSNEKILKNQINQLQKPPSNSTFTLDLSGYSSDCVPILSNLYLPNLKNLYLDHINLQNQQLNLLKNMDFSKLEFLSLRNASMTYQKLKILSLMNLSSLKYIDFSYNGIDWQGFRIISSMNLEKLVDLSIGYNNLKTKNQNQLITLNSTNLRNINLRNNQLDSNVMNLLVIKSPNLTTINLKNNKIAFDSQTNFIKFNSNFKNIINMDLSFNPIGNIGFMQFANLKQFEFLRQLNLMNTSLSDDIAQNFKNLNIPSIRYLNLKYNSLGNRFMKIISQSNFINLQYIGLNSNNISEVYNISKQNLSNIIQIDLRRNHLSANSKTRLVNEFAEKVIF